MKNLDPRQISVLLIVLTCELIDIFAVMKECMCGVISVPILRSYQVPALYKKDGNKRKNNEELRIDRCISSLKDKI